MILSVSQGEEQKRKEGTFMGKDGTPFPQQNLSFSLQFNTHLLSASPCQAPPSDVDKYQASGEMAPQTPRSFLCRREPLSLSLCHKVLEMG